jgi:aminopeptidase N
LPLYNDTNDRFTVDLTLTVDTPNVALSNGLLQKVIDNRDGSRSYHWVQDEPIPNYLLALNVGQFVEIPLAPAKVGDREIPLSVWAHRGEEDRAAYGFRRTPEMLEFFSERFGYDYAWDKYDQVVLRNFAGAMETATMVGFQETHLKRPDDPVDDGPYFAAAAPTWSYEDTISHELAHHWFGDLLTCRSLGSIFLNESFASFAHTVWNGHINGEDDLTYQRWIYRNVYLDFVAETGTVRPLEYHRYDASDDMYTQPITYIKGSLILHMLRERVGEEAFYRGIANYLKKHAFSEVESWDFQRALEDASGQNLDAFFEDWIRDGAGFPHLEVSSHWSAERRQVDLTLEQLQGDLPFENAFDLVLEVEIVTASGSARHKVAVTDWSTHIALPADSEPLMINVDKGNWIVAYIHQDRSLAETVRAVTRGDLPVALRAARQLSEDYAGVPIAATSLASVLADPNKHWGLRQEAALDLGTIGTDAAVTALVTAMGDKDARVRRAVALGLGRAGGDRAIATLKAALTADPKEEVGGAAAYSLGALQVPGVAALLQEQLERPSAYYDYRRLSALAGLAELEDPGLAAVFQRYIGDEYLREVRLEALGGWARAAPNDKNLATRLRALSRDDDAAVRAAALEHLGSLHRAADKAYLLQYAADEPDVNLANLARNAAEEIAYFNP